MEPYQSTAVCRIVDGPYGRILKEAFVTGKTTHIRWRVITANGEKQIIDGSILQIDRMEYHHSNGIFKVNGHVVGENRRIAEKFFGTPPRYFRVVCTINGKGYMSFYDKPR